MKKIFLYFLVFISLVLVAGCSDSQAISKAAAEEIALEDVSSFKPDNNNFEVYRTERKDMNYRNSLKTYDSWVVFISSSEPGSKITNPNILYQIHAKSGKIIDKTNMAFGEKQM